MATGAANDPVQSLASVDEVTGLDCAEIEKQFGSSNQKCRHYRDQAPGCRCEKHSVSPYSPGTVQPSEILIRVLYSNHQINDQTGVIDPSALGDAKELGLSVFRKGHCTADRIRKHAEEKIAKDREIGKTRGDYWRVVSVEAGKVMGLRTDDDQRCYCMLDTALEHERAHGDVCESFVVKQKDSRRALEKKYRALLFDLIAGKAITVDEAFSQ